MTQATEESRSTMNEPLVMYHRATSLPSITMRLEKLLVTT